MHVGENTVTRLVGATFIAMAALVAAPSSANAADCSGPFGSGTPNACPDEDKPVCMPSGECVRCNGQFGADVTQPCQLAAAPFCENPTGTTGATGGNCRKCAGRDCLEGDPSLGTQCHVRSGACGTGCLRDEDCKITEWCAPTDSATAAGGTCIRKTPNGQPVIDIPPIDGECTEPKGKRTCLSGVCDEDDDRCGKKNGQPCVDEGECRSAICSDTDEACGLPSGEPCQNDDECRSEECKAGTCGCKEDADCKGGLVCEAEQCVPGCRPGAGTLADGGVAPGACAPDEECVVSGGADRGDCVPSRDGAGGGTDDPGAVPTGDAGADESGGILEGGAFACSSTAAAASPLGIFGAMSGVLVLMARRRNKRKSAPHSAGGTDRE